MKNQVGKESKLKEGKAKEGKLKESKPKEGKAREGKKKFTSVPSAPQKPTFLCVGAQKAGTTWLYTQLQRHPDVWMPPIKELHYFDHLYLEATRKWSGQHILKGAAKSLSSHVRKKKDPDWDHVRYLANIAGTEMFTEEWFLRCFDHPKAMGRCCGDITPAYSAIPDEGIDYLLRLLPNVKIIYLIRDPIDRAASHVRMGVERKNIDPTEENLLALAERGTVSLRGDYAQHLPRWKARVAPSNLLLIPFGRVASDPLGLLRDIEKFLGLKECNDYEPETKVHQTKKIDLPDTVKQRLVDKFEPQRKFLEGEMGPEFTALTR